MQTTFKVLKNIGIIELDGDLNVVKVDQLREEFKNWLIANPALKNVVVDLTNVGMIDSAGLGLLISFLKQLRERGGELNLAGLQKRVGLVFDITRTRKIFGIFDDAEAAVDAFLK